MNTNVAETFVARAAVMLHELLPEKGCVLTSSCDSLRPGNFYIMGVNPGGTPTESDPILSSHLESLPRLAGNLFAESAWSERFEKGGHPIQKNIATLAEWLEFDLATVCVSNLIFLQTPKTDMQLYKDFAPRCWPVHQLILNIVHPKVLIVFGVGTVSPFRHLWQFQVPPSSRPRMQPSGHGNWPCYAFDIVEQDIPYRVIALPHLSRYVLGGKDAVRDWVRKEAKSTGKA